ncbi:MAG: hypothetical protein A3B68_01425 [Candidatus Melainabacteria bacterium RIFCSPHIGHO2_02_FULL_34_12]|nr:MAG: hypothetical protein A3B68_01425 [Candidatus Melainabacteria bacterium RIFCSPHIGHO2_02_FULL_34_12]
MSINRKQIEDFYNYEWKDYVSFETLTSLIELTCKTYHLNQPAVPDFIKEKESAKFHDLGQI